MQPLLHPLFEKTTDRLENRVGYSRKKRHKRITAVVACWILQQSNFLIDFTEQEGKRLGCSTIWHYLGWKFPMRDEEFIPIPAPNEFQRFTSAQINARHIRGGFKRLEKALLSDHRLALFMVPRIETGKRTQVITLNADYVVNDVGTTAAQMAEKRQAKRTKWSIRSATEKMAAITSTRDALLTLAHEIQTVFEEIKQNGLPAAKMNPVEAVNLLGEQREESTSL